MLGHLTAWSLGYAVPFCILLGGVFGLWTSGGYFVDAYRSAAWPQVQGKVVRSELASEERFLQSNHSTHSFWAEIDYKYGVDDAEYVSSNVTLDGLRSGPHVGTGKREAENILARYPVGKLVDISYDPNDPGRATLETGVSAGNFFVPIFSIVLTALGAYWLSAMLFTRTGDDQRWRGRERVCPKCQTPFTSIQDKGSCPECKHLFYASEAEEQF
jgi:hypothetical protein